MVVEDNKTTGVVLGLCYNPPTMTGYYIKPGILPSLAAQESKAKRKRQLEEVERRRRENYKRFMQKQRAIRQRENF